MPNKFEEFITGIRARNGGPWVTSQELPELTELHRLCQCLVRCGRCRFTAAAQDLPFLMGAIDKAGDYVRDVQIIPAELERASSWQPEHLPEPIFKPAPKSPRPATTKPAPMHYNPEFREEDCGGVFDGNGVVSDADPGL